MYHLTVKSGNEKLGTMAVSTSSSQTCPDHCEQKASGNCYARFGPLGMHWDKVTKGERGVDFDTFLGQVASLPDGTIFRHNQAGDLPGQNNNINAGQLRRLAQASAHLIAFTYTHKPVDRPSNLAARRYSIRNMSRTDCRRYVRRLREW